MYIVEVNRMSISILILTIVILIVVSALIAFFAVFFIRSRTKKRMKKDIDILETDKNSIISPTMLSEFNKVKSLVNNNTLEKKYKNWQKKFNEIKNKDIPKITDKLVELEGSIEINDIKEFLVKISNTELDIYYVKAKASTLLNDIQNITLSEERNRTAVTKLKSIYRALVQTYNKNKLNYKEISIPIELQFENIDKLFSAFELAMDKNEYDEVSKIVKALDELVNNMAAVIEEAPSIILLGKIVIPKKIKDINAISKRMEKTGYNVEYLNISYNIEESEKKLNDIFDRLNVLNLEDSIFELKTMLDYFESLYSDFDKEKISKKEYEISLNTIKDKLERITSVLKNIYEELADLKISYDLTEEELELIDNINNEVIQIRKDYKEVADENKIKILPYSKLNKDCELLNVRLFKAEDRLENTLRTLGSLKEDELRAREQLEEIKSILRDSKYKIKEYKLSLMPKNYYVQLREATEGINEIIKELEKKPISIKILNTRVDTARDLVLKLYGTANELVKTASMAEMAIVYGNKYRSTFKDVNNGLEKAEKEFFKGEYRNSLEIILNTLNVVEPGIHKKLLNAYESK